MQHLKDLKIKFNHWRANKLTISEPIPNELWKEVKRVLKHTNSILLCKSLGITQRQIRSHCYVIGQQIEPSGRCNKFIEIVPENKNTVLNQINNATITTLTELEKYEVLFTINNHPITLKLSANNLLVVLHDLKEAL